jgi:hypothetical protein
MCLLRYGEEKEELKHEENDRSPRKQERRGRERESRNW